MHFLRGSRSLNTAPVEHNPCILCGNQYLNTSPLGAESVETDILIPPPFPLGAGGLLERPLRPIGKTKQPRVKTQVPLGKTRGPLGKTPGPLGKTQQPLGKTQGPLGKTQGPLGKTPGPLGKTQQPLGKPYIKPYWSSGADGLAGSLLCLHVARCKDE